MWKDLELLRRQTFLSTLLEPGSISYITTPPAGQDMYQT